MMYIVRSVVVFIIAVIFCGPDCYGQAESEKLEELFSGAPDMALPGHCRFLIVPGAGIRQAGEVRAAAYRSIPDGTLYENIFLISSSRGPGFEGVSVDRKPLYSGIYGEVSGNLEIASALRASGPFFRYVEAAHDPEKSPDHQIPWICYHFKSMPGVVSIVIGSSSVYAARELARALIPYFSDENLFIITSDFSQYPSYRDAVRVDRESCEAIVGNDPGSFYSYLRKQSKAGVNNLVTPCSGWCPVLSLLYMSGRKEIQMKPLLYRNTGDAENGRRDRVVGYWSIAGYNSLQEQSGQDTLEIIPEDLFRFSRQVMNEAFGSGKAPAYCPPDSQVAAPPGMILRILKHGVPRGSAISLEKQISLFDMLRELSLEAAFHDDSFYPLESHEMGHIQLEISIIDEISSFIGINNYFPDKQGIILKEDTLIRYFLPGQIPGDILEKHTPEDSSRMFIFNARRLTEAGLR